MSLSKIREKIAALNVEIEEFKAARPPIDGEAATYRTMLVTLASEARERMIVRAGKSLARGSGLSEIIPAPATMPRISLGLAVLAIGVDAVVEQAEAVAQQHDNGCLRMPNILREARLQELREERYELELAEESALGGAERRADVTPGTVLGIPLEVAIERNLLGA